MFTLIGTARCSEATPQCTDVHRNEQGDIMLSNGDGQLIQIPAGEWTAVLELLSR